MMTVQLTTTKNIIDVVAVDFFFFRKILKKTVPEKLHLNIKDEFSKNNQ